MSIISAGEFKAKCLQILDKVNITREPVVVTKRGKPVAMLVPLQEAGDIYGIARDSIRYAESDDLCSTGEVWDAEG